MKLSKEFIAMFREEAKKAQWEINRWNGKSIDDLVVDYLEQKELKPEDFEPEPKKEPTVEQKPKEPEIRLSVEEAKGICSIIACFIVGKPRNLEDYKGFESMNRQILQIEQVEKDDE